MTSIPYDIRISQLQADLEQALEDRNSLQNRYWRQVNLYGSAWPGAQRQIDKATATMKAIEAELSRVIAKEKALDELEQVLENRKAEVKYYNQLADLYNPYASD